MMSDSSTALAAGTSLGHFVVRSLLGSGGMGEVYEAEDTRLHRHVALKVVRRDVASDPVRRARLEREASAVAKLNHPNVVTVHSLEEHDGVLFIAMERIEGVTLAAAMPPNGFPLDRFVPLALQLADALGAAHGLGIVHRDLKPSNIMVSRDGTLKVVDFGLSRLAVDEDITQVTADVLTADGSLLGTAPYMAPEQVEGHVADARSDLFSLGVVLFEMATGQRPFAGRTPLAVLTAIVKDPAPFARDVRSDVPEELARIIDRCLVKDPARRMQSAVDLRGRLEDLGQPERGGAVRTRHEPSRFRPQTTSGASRRPLAALGAILLVVAGVMAALAAVRGQPGVTDSRVARFTFDLPKDSVIPPEFNSHVALSPDGTELAVAALPGPVWIRRLDRLDARPLDATTTPGFRGAPFFSPDGTGISFIQGNAVISASRPFYKAGLSGGAAIKLTDYDAFHKGDWSTDGWIYWTAQYPGGIVRIRDSGGPVEPVTELDHQHGERSHRFASLLPGGQALLFTVASDGMTSYDDARIDVWDLRSKQRKSLIIGGTSPIYSPSGHIVYARRGKLLAVPFDLSRLEVTGAPFDVVDGVQMSSDTGAADYALSRRGDLAYVPGSIAGGHRSVVWVDRSGHVQALPLQPGSYLYPRLSPDGHRLAIEIEGPNHDFFVYDLDRAVLTKMTTDGESHAPVWTPDGTRLAFRSWLAGGMTMWMMPVDGSTKAVRLDPAGTRQSPVSISADGKFLSFDQKDPQTRDDAWVLALDSGRAQPLAHSRFGEGSAKFSPDGRWVAYASDESGDLEVYVQAFPGPGPRVQISSGGGFDPVWRRAGGELYYRNGKKMMAVSLVTSPQLRVSAPKQLWEGDYSDGAGSSCGMPGVSSSNYDVTPDGGRFLMIRDEDSTVVGRQIVVVLNWSEELKKHTTESRTAHR